ncbi:ABC transporter ATP-binding protein [Mongoliimonas terrestris]|uniref:ABC transporter ATP-binding protein n=1 Tax=Mongoliimonas terrestris TaxID=1709001 RepID=UPI0009496CC5|nr:ABC transporter transmembrane domain-containing protein [Mongoliimonas terrestris]
MSSAPIPQKPDPAPAAAPSWFEGDQDRSGRDVVLRIVREFVLPRRKLVARAMLAMVFVAATTGALPFLMQTAADRIFVGKELDVLYALPPIVVVVMALRSLAEYYGRMIEARISGEIVAELRQRLFERLARADLGFLQSTHSAKFISVFASDTLIVNNAASQTLTAIARNLLQALALIIAMLWLDWVLGALVLVSLPLAIFLMGRQRKKLRRSVHRALAGSGDIATLVSQMLQGIRVVKAYDQEDAEAARAGISIRRTRDANLQTQRTRALTGPFTEGLSGIGFAAAIFYGGWQGIAGRLTLGDFMGFMAAAMLIYQPLKSLAGLQNLLSEGIIAARRVFAILDEAPTVVEKPGAAPLAHTGGAIRFEGVTFAYAPGLPVIEDVTLDIPAGLKVALVGPSGAGKSTLLNLVLRFYDPSAGRVLIDGQDVATATLASVRRASALLTQDPVLFDDTVRANIAYGSPDASDAAVEAAARGADAHDFILGLPRGYDTRVGEAGGLLSGGQKQRIAFARAMLRGAPILLLDEPTSALDANSEARVQASLDTLFEGRTVLMIAHRLSTVKKADLIVVMDKGRVVETGTHESLVAAGGLYAHLHRTQLAGEGVPAGLHAAAVAAAEGAADDDAAVATRPAESMA